MILQSLIGTCFFAGIVAILSVPWMLGAHDQDEHDHAHGH
jgi:hypothetical protein